MATSDGLPMDEWHARLLERRLPVFALAWSAALVLWLLVYALESRFAVGPALVIVGAHAMILGGAVACARASYARVAAVGAALAVGLTTTLGLAAMGGPADVVAFAMLTLYLLSAVAFAWGWRAELVVYAGTIGPVLLVFAAQGNRVSSYLMGAAILIGTTTSLLVAELARRHYDAQFALRDSEAHFRSAFGNAPLGMLIVQPDGCLVQANRAFCDMLGYRPEDVLARSVVEVTHPDDLEASMLEMQRLLAGEVECIDLEKRYLHADGSTVFGHTTASLVRARDGAPLHFVAQVEDIGLRRQRDQQLQTSLSALRRSEEKLRALALRQVSIRESERKRLGLDLHDDVCQELVGIGILLASLRRRLGPMSTDNAATFDRIADYMSQLVEHLRVLARDLQPLQLHDYGLADGLRSLAEGMSSPALRIEVVLPARIPRLPESTEVTVYRFAQEAITNAVRHSDASVVELIVTLGDGVLRLVVSDDGRGFDPAQCSDSLGIVSMEERVTALGGRFTLESTPGAGTLVAMECALDLPAGTVPPRVAHGA